MSEQVKFWKGSFGAEYTKRCRPDPKDRASFWDLILERTSARSILEVGCNWGPNLRALRDADPTIKLRGVDVNASALAEAREQAFDAREVAGRDVGRLWTERFDLVFTAGCLIHVGPADLKATMESIVMASKRWVLAVEYAAEKEEEVEYRGHAARLWRRPFGLLYEDLGLDTVLTGDLAPGDGFDNTKFWLLMRP